MHEDASYCGDCSYWWEHDSLLFDSLLSLDKTKVVEWKRIFPICSTHSGTCGNSTVSPPPPYLSPYFNLLTNKWTVSKSRQKDKSHSRDSGVYDWGMANGHEKNLADTFGLLYLWSDRSQGGFLLHMLSKSWKRGSYNVLAWNFEFTSSSFYLLVMENLRLFVNAKLSNKIAQRSREKSRDRIMVMQTVYAPFLLSPWEKIWNSILYITDKDRSLGKITITSLITFSNPLYLSLLLSATFKRMLALVYKMEF